MHRHELYADYRPPDDVGLLVIMTTRPPPIRAMRALTLTEGRRPDGRWALRLMLAERSLRPVFAALCDDISSCTRVAVDDAALGSVVIRRLLHWRALMEQDGGGLGESVLRGLVGELITLRDRVLPGCTPLDGVLCWTGPQGTPQDFQLPDGRRLEVKTVTRTAKEVRINGLEQLDSDAAPLTLVVVRVEMTGATAACAMTAPSLVADLRNRLLNEPEALAVLNERLAEVGWHEHPAHNEIVLRLCAVEEHAVDDQFPRLTVNTVPSGVHDASYLIALPAPGAASRDATNDR